MSQNPYPIALLCAKTSSGQLFGRALPLWTLLPHGQSTLTTRDQMRAAMLCAESALRLYAAGTEGFAMQCEDRQIMVAQLDLPHPDEAAARAALSNIDPALLSAFDGFGAHLAEIDRLGPMRPAPRSGEPSEAELSERRRTAETDRARAAKSREVAAADKLRRRRILVGRPHHAPVALIGVTSCYSRPGLMSAAPMYCETTIAAPLGHLMRMESADSMPKTTAQAERLLRDFHDAALSAAQQSSSAKWKIGPDRDAAPLMVPVGPRWVLSLGLLGDSFHSEYPEEALAKQLGHFLSLFGPDARVIGHHMSDFSLHANQEALEGLFKSDAGLASMIEAADMRLALGPRNSDFKGRPGL